MLNVIYSEQTTIIQNRCIILKVTIAFTVSVHELIILTCDTFTKPFKCVYMSVRRPVNQCQKVNVGQLMPYSYNVNGSAELSECVYAVWQGDGDIMIILGVEACVCFFPATWIL